MFSSHTSAARLNGARVPQTGCIRKRLARRVAPLAATLAACAAVAGAVAGGAGAGGTWFSDASNGNLEAICINDYVGAHRHRAIRFTSSQYNGSGGMEMKLVYKYNDREAGSSGWTKMALGRYTWTWNLGYTGATAPLVKVQVLVQFRKWLFGRYEYSPNGLFLISEHGVATYINGKYLSGWGPLASAPFCQF